MENDIKEILVTQQQLSDMAKKLGEQITKDYEGKNLLAICVLKGSIFFFTDLVKNIKLPLAIDFISASSYGASTTSSGEIKIKNDVDSDLSGKDILIVEDILDTGNTLSFLISMLKKRNPSSIKIATLLDKPERRIADVKADYVGTDVPNEFVVGYGLDFNQKYRNLPYIGVLKEECYQ